MLMEKDVYSHGVNNAPSDDNAHQCSYFDVSVVSSNWGIWQTRHGCMLQLFPFFSELLHKQSSN